MGEIFSTIWNTVLFYPFLNVLMVLYKILGENLALAVIAIAVIVRLLMIPLTKKQTDMTSKMANMRPRLEEIQKKYKNNQQELAKAQMALYKEIGYNPVGCLGTFVPQILVLIAIVGVIGAVTQENFNGIIAPIRDFVFGNASEMHINKSFLLWKDVSKSFGNTVDGDYLSKAGFPFILLALLVAGSQYISTRFLQTYQKIGQPPKPKVVKKDPKDPASPMSPEEMQEQMAKSMNSIFPIMTGVFALQASAVLGIYWIAQSIMLILQYFIIDSNKSVQTIKQLLTSDKKNESSSQTGSMSNVVDSEIISSNPETSPKKSDKKKAKKKKKRKNR